MDAVLREARDAASCVERERRVWEPLWREVEDFVLPRCIDSPRRADEAGDTARRGPRIIDGTATRAVRILAAGMQGGAHLARASVVQVAPCRRGHGRGRA